MDNGYLNKYFDGVIVKRLSEVEINLKKSNQHEFHANKEAVKIFGSSVPKVEFVSSFLYLNDEITINAEATLSWYDCRVGNPDRAAEWRLYFPTTAVTEAAKVGDSLFICIKPDNTLLTIITQKESTVERQLYWLFGLEEKEADRFISKSNFSTNYTGIEVAGRMILDLIGVEYEDNSVEVYLESMLNRFQGVFPTTKEFSAYARETVHDIDPLNEPDLTLIKWVNREEALFRILEKYLVKERLKKGFVEKGDVDIESFMSFSLSVHNRRKSRAGFSLENHVEELLKYHKIIYTHTPMTENRAKPDFIFPSIEAYRNDAYPSIQLTMLGAKSTCKDRWRQILSEADKVEKKHLLTLEPAITENQTCQMIDKNVQLVLPEPIHDTYTIKQRKWLYTVKMFFDEIKEKQLFYEKYKEKSWIL